MDEGKFAQLGVGDWKMTNSNQTLRFPRSAREAYGHDIDFGDHHRGDRWVGYVAIFIAGLMIGGWLL